LYITGVVQFFDFDCNLWLWIFFNNNLKKNLEIKEPSVSVLKKVLELKKSLVAVFFEDFQLQKNL
jgi:hypothetical protein